MDSSFIVDVGSAVIKYGCQKRARRGGVQTLESTPSTAWNLSRAALCRDQAHTCELDVGALSQQLAGLLNTSTVNANEYNMVYLIDSLTPARTKEFLVRAAFEELAAKRVLLAYAPVTALLGLGLNSGVVVDVGYRSTTVTPVLNSVPIFTQTERLVGQGLAAVDVALAETLASAGDLPLSASDVFTHHYEYLHRLKKECAALQCSLTPIGSAVPTATLELPDGGVLRCPINGDHVAACTRMLMQGTSLLYCTQRAMRSLHRRFHYNCSASWLLIGGGGAIPGVESHLLEGMSVPALFSSPALYQQVRDTSQASWFGGAILTQVNVFMEMCMDRDAYEESGPRECLRYSMTDPR